MRKLPALAERALAPALAAGAFIVYLATLCPTLNFIDSGELSTVAYTLGVAHPTGYPLFTLLGWLFSHLPIGGSVIYKLNVMSAILCSLGLIMYFKFIAYAITEVCEGRESSRQNSGRPRFFEVTLPALFAMLLLAFSETYWSQALAIEVYSLHVLLLALSLLLFSRGILPVIAQKGKGVEIGERNLFLTAFAFVLGLSFANHMTTIFLAPAFLYLYFTAYGVRRHAWRRIGGMAPAFLVGLSVYLYLPFRASERPLLNWGDPETWEAFFRHTSAKQYSVWLFSSTETARRQLSYFLGALPEEFAYAGIVLAALGAWSLFVKSRKIFVFTLLLFLGCVLYAINYDIHDIDSYFLLAYLTIALWAAFGFRHLIGVTRSKRARLLLAGLGAAAIIAEGVLNAPKVTLSDMTLVEEYTRDMFRSVGPNAVILTYEWDYFVSASYYAQHVDGLRPDVVVIDKELMRRSWYYRQLEREHPWLIAQSRAEVDAFLFELRKFENNLPYNPQTIEFRFSSLIRSFIERNLPARPVYATPEIEAQYLTNFRRVPSGLADRLVPLAADSARTPAMVTLDFAPRVPARRDSYVDGIIGLYSGAYVRSALYAATRGERDDARGLLRRSLEIEPRNSDALRLAESIMFACNRNPECVSRRDCA